ncbi:MAG: ribonuclease E/G, partial [Rhizobiaceae bacterium]|nr:ribonuclease E/G [Rhizobiaceae bacterium]
ESAEEPVARKPRRTRKAKVAVSPVEEPIIAEEAPPVEPEVAEKSATLAEEPVAEETVMEEAAEPAKPARANRQSNVTTSEPVVTSVKSTTPEAEGDKPKKGGWWQKRGFF